MCEFDKRKIYLIFSIYLYIIIYFWYTSMTLDI